MFLIYGLVGHTPFITLIQRPALPADCSCGQIRCVLTTATDADVQSVPGDHRQESTTTCATPFLTHLRLPSGEAGSISRLRCPSGLRWEGATRGVATATQGVANGGN